MNMLEESREKIDRVDRQMAKLFEERMAAVADVARYKAQTGMAVLDAGRERAVIQKNLQYITDPALRPFYEQFLRDTMAISRQYQHKALNRDVVAYQGVEGAWSHQALRTLYPQARALSFATWKQVFDAVLDDRAALGVLPFENSNAGDVSAVLDLCYANPDIYVVQVLSLPIRQDLLALPGVELSDLREVTSHPQALSQCSTFLEQLGLHTTACANTAMAAQQVARSGRRDLAAIASEQTAQLYGLQVLSRCVNNDADNTTFFIVISKQRPAAGDHFSLLFTVSHKPGSLAKVIQTIGAAGYNLECIKSRPMPHVRFEYYFYVELEGDPSTAEGRQLLEQLNTVCTKVRVLGTYDRKPE